jgi:hypothetical protein
MFTTMAQYKNNPVDHRTSNLDAFGARDHSCYWGNIPKKEIFTLGTEPQPDKGDFWYARAWYRHDLTSHPVSAANGEI